MAVPTSEGPPPGAEIVTESTREAAVKKMQSMIDDDNRARGETEEPEPEQTANVSGTENPDETPDKPDEVPDPLDMSEIAGELLRDTLPGASKPGPTDREDALKTQLVAAGLPEKAAHTLAYTGGLENAQKVLAGLTGGVSSKGADSAPGAAVTESEGQTLSEDILVQLDGQAKQDLMEAFAGVQQSAKTELDELRQEVSYLRKETIEGQATKLAARLVEARTELAGAYPELQSPEQWDRLKPIIKAAVTGGIADDAVEGLRLAAIKLYGVRAAGAGTDNPTGSGTLKVRNGAAGGKSVTPASAKKRIAEMIFSGRPKDDIDAASATYRDVMS